MSGMDIHQVLQFLPQLRDLVLQRDTFPAVDLGPRDIGRRRQTEGQSRDGGCSDKKPHGIAPADREQPIRRSPWE